LFRIYNIHQNTKTYIKPHTLGLVRDNKLSQQVSSHIPLSSHVRNLPRAKTLQDLPCFRNNILKYARSLPRISQSQDNFTSITLQLYRIEPHLTSKLHCLLSPYGFRHSWIPNIKNDSKHSCLYHPQAIPSYNLHTHNLLPAI
jgi:hypothetical protein